MYRLFILGNFIYFTDIIGYYESNPREKSNKYLINRKLDRNGKIGLIYEKEYISLFNNPNSFTNKKSKIIYFALPNIGRKLKK